MHGKNNLYAVILAGGAGTRFWPMSRKEKPKQFLNITGRGTLLEETLLRVKSRIEGKHILIVTNALYKKEIGKIARRFKIPFSHILYEPEGKNTAPAILWAATRIHQKDFDSVMAVLPSDHLVLQPEKFLKVLDRAVSLARQDYLVTLGIIPTRPETGFGYLKTSEVIKGGKMIIKVDRFTEKPTLEKARSFIKAKNYYWNSGMFIWKTGVILEAFQKHLPQMYSELVNKSDRAIQNAWKDVKAISIDFGILERARNVVAVPAGDIGWSDLGSWQSLSLVLTQDKEGNILKGDTIVLNCRNNLIWSQKRLTAAIGLKDLIIIDTHDALLICHKDLSQYVREIVSIVQNKKRPEV